VDQPAEQIATVCSNRQRRRWDRRRPVRWHEPEHTVRSVLVVVPHVDAKHTLEMTAADDQEMVEALAADGANPALGMRIRIRCSHRRPDNLAAAGAKDLVEPTSELRVAVMDQEPEPLLLTEVDHEIARLLRCPVTVWGKEIRFALVARVG
jgi:hypothetical protein